MATKGYTDQTRVTNLLLRPLTDVETTAVETLIPGVETFIDRYTRRGGWLAPTIVSRELVRTVFPAEPNVYLLNVPVTAITKIEDESVRPTNVWTPPTDVTDPTDSTGDYQVVDLVRGWIRLLRQPVYNHIWVTYTWAGNPVPEDISLAATHMVIWLMSIDQLGVKSITIGQDISEVFEDGEDGFPTYVMKLLRTARAGQVMFA